MKSRLPTVLLFILCLSGIQACLYGVRSMSDSCSAKVYVEGDPEVDGDNTITTEFLVIVNECDESEGGFDYIIHYEPTYGGVKKKTVSGGWFRQNTSQPIVSEEKYDLGDREKLIRVEAVEDATRCVCYAADSNKNRPE